MSVCTAARNNACAHYGHRAAVGAPFPVRRPCTRKRENVMVKFILKRIGTMIIAMFMIILITFTLMHSIPGGPFTNTKGVPEEVTQAMEAKYGLDSWKSYILPVIAMGGYSVSYLARLMRSSLLEVMGQDYIRTARAKGLTEFAVVTKHALRNALIPVITVLGPTVAGLLTGSFVVEKIFAIPGIGYYFVNSVTQRDYTTIMGVTIFFAAFLMAMVLLVDIFYCLIDPRIKFDA